MSGRIEAAWAAALAITAVAGSFAFNCATPFPAYAVALAATLRLRMALAAVVAIWLANQLVGFSVLDYPWTGSSLAWGAAIAVAALFATATAAVTLRRMASGPLPLRLALVLAVSVAVYEGPMIALSFALGESGTFTPAIVGWFAVENLVWLAGLLALNEGAAAMLGSRFRVPRFAKVS